MGFLPAGAKRHDGTMGRLWSSEKGILVPDELLRGSWDYVS